MFPEVKISKQVGTCHLEFTVEALPDRAFPLTEAELEAMAAAAQLFMESWGLEVVMIYGEVPPEVPDGQKVE